MAETMVPIASVTVGDRAKKLSSFGMRVSVANAQAWAAAANQAGRDATAVGLLLDAAFDLMGSSQYFSKNVELSARNDAFVYPSGEGETYNSNKLNVSYSTLLGGLPRNLQVTVPQRLDTRYELESNGINVVLEDGGNMEAFITQLEATGLSLYGTAVTVTEVTVNDE